MFWRTRPTPSETIVEWERNGARQAQPQAAELGAREHWTRQHVALLEEHPERRAELACQVAERESAKRAAERRRQAIAARALSSQALGFGEPGQSS
jgi:hypothetical protein